MPHCVDYYVPFTVKLDAPEITEHAQILCDLKIASVDGKMINSRKALLRTNLSCSIAAYEPVAQELYDLSERPEALRIKQVEYDVEVPLEATERPFAISDSIDLPTGSRAMKRLCGMQFSLDLTDKKVIASRGLFRGNARCKLMYLSEQDDLCSHEFQVPFSQFFDLSRDYEEDELLQILPVVTGCDLEFDSQPPIQKAYLNLHILAQSMIYGKQHVTLIEDAFSTNGTFTPHWDDFCAEMMLDRTNTNQTVYHKLPTDMVRILDAQIYDDFPAAHKKEGIRNYSAQFSVHVLGYNRNNEICSVSGSNRCEWSIPMASDAARTVYMESLGSPYVTPSAEGIECRTELAMQVVCTNNSKIQRLIGGTIENADPRTAKPCVIIRREKQGRNLWDIAKSVGANEELLQIINELEGDVLPTDQMILIPVG